MKVEFDVSGMGITKVVVLLLIGIVAGYAVSAVLQQPSGQGGTQQAGVCLTPQDLNRQDMIGVVTLSRFCEGMGFASALKWERDSNGNVYGVPVCIASQR